MKRMFLGWGSLTGLALVLACSHPTDAPPEKASPSAQNPSFSPSPSPAAAKKKITENALILDVRTAEEFAEGHLAGSQLVPVQELSSRLGDVKQMVQNDLSRPVVVYCRSGGRATRAAKILHNAGFEDVTNGGGLRDLQSP